MNKLSFFADSAALFARRERSEGRDAYSVLNRFDEHMLKDIGLSRSDVERLGRKR